MRDLDLKERCRCLVFCRTELLHFVTWISKGQPKQWNRNESDKKIGESYCRPSRYGEKETAGGNCSGRLHVPDGYPVGRAVGTLAMLSEAVYTTLLSHHSPAWAKIHISFACSPMEPIGRRRAQIDETEAPITLRIEFTANRSIWQNKQSFEKRIQENISLKLPFEKERLRLEITL